jgi:hypothetical protein
VKSGGFEQRIVDEFAEIDRYGAQCAKGRWDGYRSERGNGDTAYSVILILRACSANFPLDKVFAEIRYVCGLPPARGILRAGANFGMLSRSDFVFMNDKCFCYIQAH